MSQEKLPTHIRVHGRVYRLVSAQNQQYRKARQRVGELATILDIVAESADTLKREIDHGDPEDVKSYGRVANRLTGLAAPMEAANKILQRTVRTFLRAGILDPELASSYFPWSVRERDVQQESEEGREPITGGDITDWKGVPGAEGPEEAIYPLGLKTLHWSSSSAPTAIEYKGRKYTRRGNDE